MFGEIPVLRAPAGWRMPLYALAATSSDQRGRSDIAGRLFGHITVRKHAV